jgi:hypothetical protein
MGAVARDGPDLDRLPLQQYRRLRRAAGRCGLRVDAIVTEVVAALADGGPERPDVGSVQAAQHRHSSVPRTQSDPKDRR